MQRNSVVAAWQCAQGSLGAACPNHAPTPLGSRATVQGHSVQPLRSSCPPTGALSREADKGLSCPAHGPTSERN